MENLGLSGQADGGTDLRSEVLHTKILPFFHCRLIVADLIAASVPQVSLRHRCSELIRNG